MHNRARPVFERYSQYTITRTALGNPVAEFRDPEARGVAYSSGGFAAVGGTGAIMHDAVSLERYLTLHDDNTPRFNTWRQALAALRA